MSKEKSKKKTKKTKKKSFKEIKIPMKFNLGTLQFEPKLDELKKWKKKKSSKQEK